MNAGRFSVFAGRLQAVMEDCFPAALTINGQAYDAARGAWRQVARFDSRAQANVEFEVVTVRVRKALLAADGVEVHPGQMSVVIDGRAAIVTDVRDGESDPVWVLGCEAAGE